MPMLFWVFCLFVKEKTIYSTIYGYMDFKKYFGFQNRITLQSRNCTTEYLLKDQKNTNSKGYMDPYVYSSIVYSSQTMEATRVH